jgi:hypothetical protein
MNKSTNLLVAVVSLATLFVLIAWQQLESFTDSFVIQLQLSRLLLLFACSVGCITGVIYRSSLGGILKAFFLEPQSGLNLAIVRIAVYTAVLVELPWHRIYDYLLLPVFLRRPPPGIQYYAVLLDLPQWCLEGILVVFYISVAMSLVGLFTKQATQTAALFGLVALAIPELFGKVDHYHYLYSIMVLLAFSPCGDFLSLDRLRSNTDQSLSIHIESSRYGLPIRCAVLTLGVFYFFAGYWKWMNVGFEYIFTENMRLLMIHKWLDAGAGPPAIRIDQSPFLYMSGAFACLVFELGFIAIMFMGRSARASLGLMGISFHELIALFLQIPFRTLEMCYATLLDWYKVFRGLGLISPMRGTSPATRSDTVREVLVENRLLVIACSVLVAGNVFAGFMHLHSWPFSCPPDFSYRYPTQSVTFGLNLQLSDGSVVFVKRDDMNPGVDSTRFGLLLAAAARQREPAVLRGLWDTLRLKEVDGKKVVLVEGVSITREILPTYPELRELHRRVVWTFRPD